jgi:hypothetical protein
MNENHKNHKLMWNELARTGVQDKRIVMERLRLAISCYACVSDIESAQSACCGCPINWTDEKGGICEDKGSPYEKWLNAKTVRTRKKYALIIANMKWGTKK